MRPQEAYAAAVEWPKADEAPPSQFLPASSLDGQPVPPREWHVEGLIPCATVSMLCGDGGIGKSLLALQLAVATAAGGRPWIGRPCAGGGALYFSAEDDKGEMHRRLADIVQAEALALADLDRLILRSLAGEDALLAVHNPRTNALAATPLFDELDAHLGAERPALAVLDTLADLHSGPENDRSVARQFIGLLRGLAIRHECAVLLLAHPSLAGMTSGSGSSGSTAWNASVRSRLYLERVVHGSEEADPDRRRLVVKKSNYGPLDLEIIVRWQQGTFVAEASETGFDRLAAGVKAERVFLALLRLHAEQGRRVNASGGASYAPKAFAEHPACEGEPSAM